MKPVLGERPHKSRGRKGKMTTENEMNLFDEIWNNAEKLAEAAADLDDQIEAKYGYPTTDHRAKNEEHREISRQYFRLIERSQKLAEAARAVIFE